MVVLDSERTLTSQELARTSDDENVRQYEGMGWQHALLALQIKDLMRTLLNGKVQFEIQKSGKDFTPQMIQDFRYFMEYVAQRRKESDSTYNVDEDKQMRTFRELFDELVQSVSS